MNRYLQFLRLAGVNIPYVPTTYPNVNLFWNAENETVEKYFDVMSAMLTGYNAVYSGIYDAEAADVDIFNENGETEGFICEKGCIYGAVRIGPFPSYIIIDGKREWHEVVYRIPVIPASKLIMEVEIEGLIYGTVLFDWHNPTSFARQTQEMLTELRRAHNLNLLPADIAIEYEEKYNAYLISSNRDIITSAMNKVHIRAESDIAHLADLIK